MAATERIMGSNLQQSSSSMGSSAILSFKPLQYPIYEFGRSYKKLLPSLQASMPGKEDRSSATLRKSDEESSGRRSSTVSSLLKAVQEGGPSVVLQQVSSIRHFFMPELPHAIIKEIKKRMALSFKDQDDDENEIQDDLNGGLLEEDHEEQVTLLGPRCAWPRLKLASAEGELARQKEVTGGPRCAWPRAAQTQSYSTTSGQHWKQEERRSSTKGEGVSGAKCNQNNPQKEGISKSPQEGFVSCMSALEGLQNGVIFKSSQESLELKEALSKSVQEGKEEALVNNRNSVQEGPRCAWPRSTPRRMLATGVGLSLMNYLFIGQGAPALAILLETPLPIICEEEPSFFTPHKILLP